MHSGPVYYALSYVWGDVSNRESIVVDGYNLSVTATLASALREISREYSSDGAVYLWADALCINQNDQDERSYQVGLMHSIYTGAHQVLSWLGSRDYRAAFKYIRTGAHLIESRDDTSWIERFPELMVLDYDLKSLEARTLSQPKSQEPRILPPDPTGNHIWDTIELLACDEYWTRVWILQEIWLNKETILLTLGARIHIQHLWDFLIWFQDVQFYPDDPASLRPEGMEPQLWKNTRVVALSFANISSMIEALLQVPNINQKLGNREAEPLLLEMHRFNCSVQVDRVYGIRAISNMELKIDYTSSVEKVYVTAAEELVTKTSLERILFGWGIGTGRASKLPGLPSWVPDWGLPPVTGYLSSHGTGAGISNADDDLDKLVLAKARNGVLTARMIFVDSLVGATTWTTTDDLRDFCLNAFLGFQDLIGTKQNIAGIVQALVCINQPLKGEHHRIHRAIALLFFLIIGREWRRIRQCRGYETILQARLGILGIRHNEEFESDTRKIMLGQEVPSESRSARYWLQHVEYDAVDWIRNLRFVCKKLAMVETKGSRLGLGPVGSQKGDEVWILPGSHYPLLLRKADGVRKFVGMCRINGLMDGEVFEQVERGILHLEEVSIV
ncbi:hypothetical protein TruAng_006072 [Truncatella angustata]|nr:hypothetical protein TruAng_006072 [Truncatella angustata]